MLFTEAPADFVKEIDVVGCYLECEGEIVLLRRQMHKVSGGKFGLPAGKVDPGETITQAMRREISEETGLDLPEVRLEHIGSTFVCHEGHDFVYHMFVTHFDVRPPIVINPKEHQGFRWATPQEALQLDLIHDLDECLKTYYKL